MKRSLINLPKMAFAAILFLSLQSCNRIFPGTWKNENIAESKRDKFHELNTHILKYLQNNDQAEFKLMLSKDTSKKNFAANKREAVKWLQKEKFHLLDEYYMVHRYADTDTVVATGPQINRYGIKLPFVTTEMYCAFFVTNETFNQTMIAITYGKYPSGWKLIDIQPGAYAANGQTGPQLYAQAHDQFDKKQLQASFFNATLAVTFMKPNTYWQYPDEIDANHFFLKVREAAVIMYEYPFVLNKVSSGPMVLMVDPKVANDGIYPDVLYMTHYNIKDTVAVKKENMEMRGIINTMMPGLTDGYKYIYYSAFNTRPTATFEPPHFDMAVKVH